MFKLNAVVKFKNKFFLGHPRGGSKKKQISLKFKFGLLKTDGGGLNFSKKSKFQEYGSVG